MYNDELRCSRSEALLIQATLRELHHLLSDTEKLKKRYKLDLCRKDEDSIDQSTLEGLSAVSGSLNDIRMVSPEEHHQIAKRAKAITNASNLPKRLFWAACDRENMREMVQAAHGFIDQLTSHLEQQHQREIRRKLDTSILTNVELTSRVDGLNSLMDALTSGLNGMSKASRTAITDDIEQTIQTKTLRLELGITDDEQGMQKPASTSEKTPINLDPNQLKRPDESDSPGAREIATYDSDKVYVEWKTIRDRRHIRKLKPRIQALCRLLRAPKSPGFRALKCRGLIELVGKDMFGMVYELPEQAAGGGFSYRLRDTFGFSPCRPSASRRRGLALDLSTALMLLHTAGWVHKGIRSSNVLYFRPTPPALPDDTDEILRDPWLMGYEYARFDNPEMLSELQSAQPGVDVYRHPDLLGGEPCSFTKVHDVYALGLLLLEIGFWCPLTKIIKNLVDIEHNPAPSAFFGIRDFILGNSPLGKEHFIVQQLRFYMGDAYTEVVKKCIEGEGFEDTVQPFQSMVVQALADMDL